MMEGYICKYTQQYYYYYYLIFDFPCMYECNKLFRYDIYYLFDMVILIKNLHVIYTSIVYFVKNAFKKHFNT